MEENLAKGLDISYVIPRSGVANNGLTVFINGGEIVYKQKADATEDEINCAISTYLHVVEELIRDTLKQGTRN